VPPSALNNGEYVELLLGRITAPYFNLEDFDDLPTPFWTVAVDLVSDAPVVEASVAPRRTSGPGRDLRPPGSPQPERCLARPPPPGRR
jgi:hypothetical protein